VRALTIHREYSLEEFTGTSTDYELWGKRWIKIYVNVVRNPIGVELDLLYVYLAIGLPVDLV
jgi:hypothetical protein